MNSVRYDSSTILLVVIEINRFQNGLLLSAYVFLALGHKRLHTRENTPLVLTTHIAITCFIRILSRMSRVSSIVSIVLI